jgi:hypothetical protein
MELLGGLAGGGWGLLAGWILPCGLAVSLFALLVFPELEFELARDIAALGATEQWVIVVLCSIALGLIVSSVQTPLYQWLEGYTWPTRLRGWGRRRQIARKRRLKRELDDLQEKQEALNRVATDGDRAELPDDPYELRIAWIYERLQAYPSKNEQILPSRLGNAIRSFETYGQDRYELDSQSLWHDLIHSAPQSLQDEVGQARVSTDFFVCLTYVLPLLALTSVGAVVEGSRGGLGLSIFASVMLGLAFLTYRLAIVGTRYWAQAVQALVNIGRAPLAANLGLELPARIEDERAMWRSVGWLVSYGFTRARSDELAPYAAARDGGKVPRFAIHENPSGSAQVELRSADGDLLLSSPEYPSAAAAAEAMPEIRKLASGADPEARD